MCRVADVSVSGFYAYLKRPLSWRRVVDEILMAHVRIAFAASGATYGVPRVLQELRAQGFPTSQKRVARLMREYIETWYSRKRGHSTLGCLSPAAYEALLPVAA
jgi:transposase InsO family protein